MFTRRGQRARYDYDFGSTTELSLSVAGRGEGEPFVCDQHASAHHCGDEGLLPVVNSPRMGTCSYTGPLR